MRRMADSKRLIAIGLLLATPAASSSAPQAPGQSDSAPEVPATEVSAFRLPASSLISPADRQALVREREAQREVVEAYRGCPPLTRANAQQASAIRACQAAAFYRTSIYTSMMARYPVRIEVTEIAGTRVEIIRPADNLAPENANRVLINLHGGAFQFGSMTMSRLESAPIAALGRITVISIDYRMAPEYSFPAASEDVERVYRHLLRSYSAHNIGMFGCSAGGVLTAESLAWFQNRGLQRPGAVGMFCGAGGFGISEGDSGYVAAAMNGAGSPGSASPYFLGASPADPLVAPNRSPAVLRRFPPALLISATRDLGLSSTIQTHQLLVREGIDAHLHIWEGVGHCFFYNSDLSQSHEAFRIIIDFFRSHLGRPGPRQVRQQAGNRH